MGSISLPTLAIIAAAGTATAAGVAAYESHEQGVAAANMDKQKGRAAAIDEKQKQIDMRENMLKALAAQNAGSLGAIGTGGATSFGANTRRQITQGQNDLLISKANSSAQVSLFDAAGSDARSAGDVGAAGDILKGVAGYAGAGGIR